MVLSWLQASALHVLQGVAQIGFGGIEELLEVVSIGICPNFFRCFKIYSGHRNLLMSYRSREWWFPSLTLCFRVDLHISSGTFWISILCLHSEGASIWAFHQKATYHDAIKYHSALSPWAMRLRCTVWGKDFLLCFIPYQSAPAGARMCPWGTSPCALLHTLQ